MPQCPRILLVDDEPPVTHVLGLKLRGMGMDVVTAQDGEEGYESATQTLPNAIVTDFQMPVRSGYEMALDLADRTQTANIPIILLTARGHTLDADALAKTNIVRLMDKPFSANELSQAVKQLLEQSEAPGDQRTVIERNLS